MGKNGNESVPVNKKQISNHAIDVAGDRNTGLWVASIFVLFLVVVSSLAVVYSTYKSRQLFSDLQQQKRQALLLDEQWGRLLLEQSTWASHERIERLAKTKLKMIVPSSQEMVVISQ